MKKKQVMAKMAAITMAVMMGATTLPASAINVFAKTAVATEDGNAVATGMPTTTDVQAALDADTTALNASTLASDGIASIDSNAVADAINTAEGPGEKLDNTTTGAYQGLKAVATTDVKDNGITQLASTYDASTGKISYAYKTFTVTLTRTIDGTDVSQAYTVKVAANKLTTTEETSENKKAVDAFKTYAVDYISANGPIARGTGASTDLTNKLDAAVTAFNADSDINIAATADFDNAAIGTYSITVSSPSVTDNKVSGVAKFFTDDQVSVKATRNGDEASTAKLKSAVLSMYALPVENATTNSFTQKELNDLQTQINTGLDSKYQIENVSATDANNFSFDATDSTGTYRVTIGLDLEDDAKDIKSALDKFFDKTTFTVGKDKTLSNYDIAKKAAADSAVNTALDAKDASISGSGAALGSDNAVTLKITISGKTYVYTNTATVERSDKTKEEANSEALKEINAKTYPDYHLEAETGNTKKDGTGDAVKHNADWLKNEITADLKAAGYDVSSLDTTWTPSAKKATSTANGSYKVVINSADKDVVNIALTYSSDQKSKDTNDSLLKVVKKGSTAGTDGADDMRVTDHAASDDAVKNNTATEVDGNKVYTFDENSSLSKAIQAKDAVKATSTADAVKVVEDKINEQLKKDGVDTNGVKVSVKAVNVQAGKDGKIDAGQSDAAADKNGKVTLLVTTSIKNDFYGSQDKLRNVENNYVLVIDTNQLKPNAVKSITLKDKSVLLTNDYYTKASSLNSYGDEIYQNNGTKCTFVEITPEIDPEDANTKVDYKVYNSKKEDVTTDVVKDVYKKGASSKVSVAANSLGLAITEAGTYTITAAADDAEATMTLTVRNNFKDVPATAYYADAVVWAYGADVTAGTSDDTFGTNDPVTRAQYVTWLYKYAVSQDPTIAIADDDMKSVFSDVSTTAFYAKAVQWAKENGITAGTTATTFSPDQAITRAQAIQMLWVAKGRPYAGLGQENEETLKFNDVPDNAFYKTAVKWAVQHGVTAGTSATTFGPNDICRRCQAIQFIYIGKDVNR